jgi:hypothetical protein
VINSPSQLHFASFATALQLLEPDVLQEHDFSGQFEGLAEQAPPSPDEMFSPPRIWRISE